jgi:hypothetical protein
MTRTRVKTSKCEARRINCKRSKISMETRMKKRGRGSWSYWVLRRLRVLIRRSIRARSSLTTQKDQTGKGPHK